MGPDRSGNASRILFFSAISAAGELSFWNWKFRPNNLAQQLTAFQVPMFQKAGTDRFHRSGEDHAAYCDLLTRGSAPLTTTGITGLQCDQGGQDHQQCEAIHVLAVIIPAMQPLKEVVHILERMLFRADYIPSHAEAIISPPPTWNAMAGAAAKGLIRPQRER